MANAPPGQPSDTPRPGGIGSDAVAGRTASQRPPLPPRRPTNPTASSAPSGNPRFGTVQYQVPGSGQGGPLSRSPIYTALNLFGRG